MNDAVFRVNPAHSNLAFGVDPYRKERYSLRQSRYDAIASDVENWASAAARDQRKLSVLEIGSGTGVLLRYLEHRPHFGNVLLSGTDLRDSPGRYLPAAYQEFFVGDLMDGYPEIPSECYDIVICEQVLEHLSRLDGAIATMARLLKPGGRLLVGVPIFLPGLRFAREHLVPLLDALTGKRRGSRGHLQAFSKSSFLREIAAHSSLRLIEVRGFRIISGGLLRPLENYRWWWQFNRRIGKLIPSACIEVQAIFEKLPES
jgi:SAM-dependent methyltransferase